MDKQVIYEFDRLYFAKKQIERRIYSKEQLEEIWNEISQNRKSNAITLDVKDVIKNNIWINITEEIKYNIVDINNGKDSQILSYLSSKNKEKLIKDATELEMNASLMIRDYDSFDKIAEVKKDLGSKDDLLIGNLYDILTDLKEKTIVFNEEYIKDVYVKLNGVSEVFDKDNNQIKSIISFLNKNTIKSPIINASVLHYYIINTKPFVKYNDLLARLLSYSYLINNGYQVLKYTSISNSILSENKKYNLAIEYSNEGDGDVTYFVKYYTNSIRYSLKAFYKDISVKHGKKIIKQLIEKSNSNLDERVVKFINSIIVSNDNIVTISDYKDKMKVSYETARTDLNSLVTLGFLKIGKLGKKYEYYINDIATIIESFEE